MKKRLNVMGALFAAVLAIGFVFSAEVKATELGGPVLQAQKQALEGYKEFREKTNEVMSTEMSSENMANFYTAMRKYKQIKENMGEYEEGSKEAAAAKQRAGELVIEMYKSYGKALEAVGKTYDKMVPAAQKQLEKMAGNPVVAQEMIKDIASRKRTALSGYAMLVKRAGQFSKTVFQMQQAFELYQADKQLEFISLIGSLLEDEGLLPMAPPTIRECEIDGNCEGMPGMPGGGGGPKSDFETSIDKL